MPRKKKPPLSFAQQMKKIEAARLKGSRPLNEPVVEESSNSIESLSARIQKILGIVEAQKKNPHRMLFFVMYDIESNKVRNLVHKYLKRQGCTPIQRSIFLADTPMDTYKKIRNDLAEVQAAYENNDSIIVLPVSTDYLNMMKVIGQKIELDIITHTKHTLFF